MEPASEGIDIALVASSFEVRYAAQTGIAWRGRSPAVAATRSSRAAGPSRGS